MCGQPIPVKDSAKYLGIILDKKLNWNEHVEHRLSKCIRILWCCRSAIGNTWGITPKSILWIYTAIVRPTLAYGAFLWWRYTLTENGKKKLAHLQRVACLAITGAMSTTPQSAIEALLNLPSLDNYVTAEGRATAYRIRHQLTSQQLRNRISHTNALLDLYKYEGIVEAPNDHIKTTYIFDKGFNIIIPKEQEWTNDQVIINYHSNIYFADGSVRRGLSGYGAYVPNDQLDIRGHLPN